MMRKNLLIAVALIIFTGYCATTLINKDRTDKVKDLQIQAKTIDLNKLQLDTKALQGKYETELQQKNVNQDKVKQLEDERIKLQQQLDKANTELQAKNKAKADAKLAAENALKTVTGQSTALATSPAPSGPVSGCGDNADANFIYMHESGCNPSAVNSIGCRGIGQACPGSKLPCGADYACQNAYFTRYALDRYGSWANARAFWVSHRWW